MYFTGTGSIASDYFIQQSNKDTSKKYFASKNHRQIVCNLGQNSATLGRNPSTLPNPREHVSSQLPRQSKSRRRQQALRDVVVAAEGSPAAARRGAPDAAARRRRRKGLRGTRHGSTDRTGVVAQSGSAVGLD